MKSFLIHRDRRGKSIALTVLGVMFDEAGRYVNSIERLEKSDSIQFQKLFCFLQSCFSIQTFRQI